MVGQGGRGCLKISQLRRLKPKARQAFGAFQVAYVMPVVRCDGSHIANITMPHTILGHIVSVDSFQSFEGRTLQQFQSWIEYPGEYPAINITRCSKPARSGCNTETKRIAVTCPLTGLPFVRFNGTDEPLAHFHRIDELSVGGFVLPKNSRRHGRGSAISLIAQVLTLVYSRFRCMAIPSGGYQVPEIYFC
jgi:hypothetical protein